MGPPQLVFLLFCKSPTSLSPPLQRIWGLETRKMMAFAKVASNQMMMLFHL